MKGRDGNDGTNTHQGYEPDGTTIILEGNKLKAVKQKDRYVKNYLKTADGKLRVVVGVEGSDAEDVNYDVDVPTFSTPPESLFTDVKLGLAVNKHQVNEGGNVDLIYTVTNSGSATATSITLDLIYPATKAGKRITYGTPVVDKTKAGKVSGSGKKYTITNLESGGAVSITVPTTFQNFGSYAYSGLVTLSENNVDKSADDNRASVQIDVTTARDTSYQPTQSCPALNVQDVGTGKSLLLMNYGIATYITNLNTYVQAGRAQPATMNRLNVYSPTTKQIKLRVPHAGTAVVHGFSGVTVSNNVLQDTVNQKANGSYTYIVNSERTTAYELNGKRYVVSPQLDTGVKNGSSAHTNGDMGLDVGIQRDKRTYFGRTPTNLSYVFENELLTINGVVEGTFLAVSFRPTGSNCEWQTVLISVPKEVPVPEGLKLTVVQGQQSHVQISSGLSNRPDVSSGYANITGDLTNETPIIPLDVRASDKAVISAPSGTKNVYKLSVTGGKLNPQTTSQGNVKIVPNSAGTELTITVEASATSSDNFIYKNNDVIVDMKIA